MKQARARTASGGEAWLLATPAHARVAELASAFAHAPPARLLASGAEARATAEALAAALGTGGECTPVPAEPRAALEVLVAALEAGSGRIVAVLPPREAAALIACALELAPERAGALRLDAGRLCLLRDDPDGFVLRRANVLAPERTSGTALPTGKGAAP